MILINKKTVLLGLVIATLATGISSDVMASRGLAVDNAKLGDTQGVTRIEVIFSCPNRYLDHYPQGDTDKLQLNLLRMTQCNSQELAFDRQEVKISGQSSFIEVTSMEYELRQGDDANLQIRFDQPVGVNVFQPEDKRRLVITIKVDAPKSDLLPAIATAPGSTDSPEQKTEPTSSGAALGDRPLADAQVVSLMGEAEAVFLQENYARAIQIYTRIMRAKESSQTPRALELLGLSRERNGQLAHATAEYQRFLDHYPDNEGADRVRQRMAGLVTANRSPKSAASASMSKSSKSATPLDVYGGISQYYRGDTFKISGRDSVHAQSSILTNADLSVRRRGKRIDLSSRLSLGNMWDLLGKDKGPESQTRLYQGYVDLDDKPTGLRGRLGRQTMRSHGVLGRFDGLHLGWEFMPGKRINLMGGYPVETTADGIKTGRDFLGMALDLEEVADRVDLSFFYNLQNVDGLKNREAIGTELRYFDSSKSVIALLDYDIGYKTLNSLILTGNWNVRDSLTLSGSIDYRTSPFLTTRSALIGQGVGSIDELRSMYTDDFIRQLAKDRTGAVSSFRLGASQSLSERFQLNADFSMTTFDGTVSSGGVLATPDQDTQYYVSLNLVGSRLFTEGDTSIFGLRHISGMTSSTSTLSLDSRFSLNRKFQINPRLRASLRNNKINGTDSWTLLPSLRLIYRIGRHYRLDFETGAEWLNQNSSNGTGDRKSWFIYAGYRADF